MSAEKIRVIIAKPGLDGHDRGAKVVARALRDAGMEVIYTGLRQTPEMIVEAALQEDVDIIGYRIMDAAPKVLIPILFEQMTAEGILHIPVVVGGIIPQAEENGMIIPIGEWVLRAASKQAKYWEKQGFSAPHVAVNLSARQIHHGNLPALIQDILKHSHLDP